MAQQFIDHRAEASDQHREVSFALEKVGYRAGDVAYEPLGVVKGHHQVLAALPDGDRNGELTRIKAPLAGEGKVVVDPAPRPRPPAVHG